MEMAVGGDRLLNRQAGRRRQAFVLFALVMIAVGIAMLRPRAAEGDPSGGVDLDRWLEMESHQLVADNGH
jgi:hypothetical protein